MLNVIIKKYMNKIILALSSFITVVAICITYFVFCPMHNFLKSKRNPISVYEDNKLIVSSYNIRNDCDHGYRNFKYRAPLIKKNIELINPDIIGMQEVTTKQFKYFKSILKNYEHEVFFRENGTSGESCPLFFNPSVFEKIDSSSFYLSDTPLVYSISWNSACHRVCSYVLLKDKKTNKKLVVANTHLDLISEEARVKGFQTILNELNRRELSEYPTLIMGDFNEYYNEDENDEFQNLIRKDFVDAAVMANPSLKFAPTFNGYDVNSDLSRIDYIVGSKNKISFTDFKIYNNLYDIKLKKNQFPSDHYPISAEFVLE